MDREQCGKDWHGIRWNVIFGHCNMVKKEEKNMNAAGAICEMYIKIYIPERQINAMEWKVMRITRHCCTSLYYDMFQ